MKLISIFNINSEADLIYTKVALRNYFKHDDYTYLSDSFIFAAMELGTNLVKYANGGEIWLLRHHRWPIIAALDRGGGIEDITWALKKGTSSSQNSLGLGLHQLSMREGFSLEIFTQKHMGSAMIFFNNQMPIEDIFFTQSFLHNNINGDFFAQKHRYSLFGDANGHGPKAQKAATFIKKFFFDAHLSCIQFDTFLHTLDQLIKKHGLRGAVLTLTEKDHDGFQVCGIGNIGIFDGVHFYTPKDGIIGVSYSGFSQFSFRESEAIILFSDGIDQTVISQVVSHDPHPVAIAIAAHYYSTIKDDRSIAILQRRRR